MLGPGPDEEFSSWTFDPLIAGGAAATVIAFLAFGLRWFVRDRRTLHRATAVVTGISLVVLVGSFVDHHERAHPQGFERGAADKLPVLAGVTTDVTTEGSSPYDDSLVASPGVDRITGCGALVRNHRLRHLAQRARSVGRPGIAVASSPSLVDGPPCFWYARYHGWTVDGEIIDNQTVGIARISVDPPNDL